MSTAQDLPVVFGEPQVLPPSAPVLRLVPTEPLDFDDAVRRVRPRLHRYAIRRLGDAHEAEELVQEALLRAYSHREQLLTEEDLSAWTTVVTGRLVIDRLRVRGRSTSVADVPENARLGRDTADVVVARDEARTALDALDAMPARQAALLWAREVEGLSYDELCGRFGMTEPAVRSVLTRARKALRKEYELRGGTLPVGGLAVLAPWVSGLSWADKLRSAVSRITAPAALATIGVTTLGGLVISPFGAAVTPGTTTFAPAQAVVSSVPAVTEPVELVPHGLAPVVGPSAGKPVKPPTPAAREGLFGKGLARADDPIPCVRDSMVTLPEPVPPVGGLPSGTPGAGNGGCVDGQNRVTVGKSNPVIGDRSVALESDLIECAWLQPVAEATNVVTCTPRETQP